MGILKCGHKKGIPFIYCYRFNGLNMYLVPQVSVNFRMNPFSKLYTNLVLHL